MYEPIENSKRKGYLNTFKCGFSWWGWEAVFFNMPNAKGLFNWKIEDDNIEQGTWHRMWDKYSNFKQYLDILIVCSGGK